MVLYTSDSFNDLRRVDQNTVIGTVILYISDWCTGSTHFVLFPRPVLRNYEHFSLTSLSEVIFMWLKKDNF